MFVSAGGSASAIAVSAIGDLTMAGGTLSGVSVSGGTLFQFAGNTTDVTLGSGGRQTVLGGIASGTVVSSGGFQFAGQFFNGPAGGTAVNTLVHSGGTLALGVFGLTSGAVIENGAFLFELAGVTSNVSLSGTQFVGGGLPGVPQPIPAPTAMASGTTVSSGGAEFVNSNGSAIATNVLSGGEIIFNGGVVSGLSVASGGVIDLATFAFSSSAKLSFVENAQNTGGVLTISGGTGGLSITLLGQYIAAGFQEKSDGAAGTAISYAPSVTSHIALAGGHQ